LKKIIAAAILTGLILVCSAASAEDISFKDDVLPVLNQNCVVCHMEGSEEGKLSLYPDAYGNLVGKASGESPLMRVAPGQAAKSYLYQKLTGKQAAVGGSGKQMPFDQAALDPAQIEKIRLWIEQGAKQN
jgi:mono/diheme cytochrome c family protein